MVWPNGKASVSGTEDCEFESRHHRHFCCAGLHFAPSGCVFFAGDMHASVVLFVLRLMYCCDPIRCGGAGMRKSFLSARNCGEAALCQTTRIAADYEYHIFLVFGV